MLGIMAFSAAHFIRGLGPVLLPRSVALEIAVGWVSLPQTCSLSAS